MAEAVGLAASIVGLVSFAGNVSRLCGYYGEAKNAREDIKKLAAEISSLAELLEQLSTTAEVRDASQTPGSDWMSQLVHEFREILQEIQSKLPSQISEQSGSRTRIVVGSLKTSLIWPFKKEATQGQIQKIERMKTSIALKLQLWVAHIF